MGDTDFDRRKLEKKLGIQIAKVRKSKGSSQDRLELESGLARGVLGPVERGIYELKASTHYRIAEVLGANLRTKRKKEKVHDFNLARRQQLPVSRAARRS